MATANARSTFDGPPTSVRDANTLNHDCRAAPLPHGLGHHSCKLGVHKAGKHLDGEAVRYDEQVLGETERGTGKLLEGPSLFAGEMTHRGCERLLA